MEDLYKTTKKEINNYSSKDKDKEQKNGESVMTFQGLLLEPN